VRHRNGEVFRESYPGPCEIIAAAHDSACVNQLRHADSDSGYLQPAAFAFADQRDGEIDCCSERRRATATPVGGGLPTLDDRAAREVDDTGGDLGSPDIDADRVRAGHRAAIPTAAARSSRMRPPAHS
jgi:hypothetical protein